METNGPVSKRDGASAGEGASPPDWASKVVLVTGGSGFIGQHLLAQLVASGCRPTAVARKRPQRFLSAALESGVDWQSTDLMEPGAARSLLKEVAPNVIFHLAGLVKGTRDRSMVLPMLDANVRLMVELMDAAVDCGCDRFVQAGSLEEPDDLKSAPSSPYAAAKLAASAYARLYRDQYGLATAVARIFMVYGPGVQDENKLVPYVIRSLLAAQPVQVSGGTRPVDWVYVEDLAAGLIALAACDAASAELGSGELHTVRSVVEKIYVSLGQEAQLETLSPFGSVADRAHERVRVADLSANSALGWRPQVSLVDGLARTIEWFDSQT